MNCKTNILICLLLFILLPCSCKDQATEASLRVETKRVNFSAEQNTKMISCSSDVAIHAESSQPEWCTATAITWNNSKAIEISVLKNSAMQERTAIVNVSTGKAKPVQIEVKQASGTPFFTLGANATQQFNLQAEQRPLTVNTNIPFTANSSAPSWCTAVVNPDATENNLTISVTENTGAEDRYAEIMLAAFGFNNITIHVVQRTSSSSSNNPCEGNEDNIDNIGHRLYCKAGTLSTLKRGGPFIRLADGSIFSPGTTSCYISKNDGVTWIEFPAVDPAKYNMGSPVSVQTRKGTIVVGFYNEKVLSPLNWNKTTHCYDPNAKLPSCIMYSKNNGQTWSEPITLHEEWTGMNREILETQDGHIVFSTMKMRNNMGRHCVMTYVSSDEGQTWKASNILDNPSSAGDHSGMMEASIVQLKDGRLWMLIRTNWDYFYESYSSDNGLTWSAYQKTNIDASSSPGALMRLESGRIVLVWDRLYHKGKNSIGRLGGDKNLSEVAASWQRDELSMMYSDNDGKTWSKPFIVAENITPITDPWDTNHWLSYPHILERTKGLLWITTGHGGLKIAISENDLPE